jgi:ABC-type branched-subunit amino acid transport system ATPase component
VTVEPHEVVLKTAGLVKRFGSNTAVDGLDLEVRKTTPRPMSTGPGSTRRTGWKVAWE